MTGKKNRDRFVAMAFIVVMIVSWMPFSNVYGEVALPKLIVDSTKVNVGSSFSLTLEAENMDGAKWKGVSGLETFDVLSTSRSSNMSIINGKTTKINQLQSTIMTKQAGEYELVGYIDYKGKTYKTNKVNIIVAEKDEQSNIGDENGEKVFLKTKLSKENVYFGEKIILTYELYSQYRIDNFGFENTLEFDGCITNPVAKDGLRSNYVTINNQKYVKYEVYKTILTPSKIGTINIPSNNLEVILSTGDFFSQGKSIFVSSEEKKINVKSLPIENKPAKFSGLVGTVNLTGTYNQDTIKYGDSVTLNAQISGNADLAIIDTLTSNKDKDFTIYETQRELKEDIVNDQYKAEKGFEVIFIPKDTGDLEIPKISIDYFDVKEEKYKTLSIDSKGIEVTGEKKTLTTVENSNSDKFTEVVINQVNPTENSYEGYFIIKKLYVYLGIAMIVILLIVFVSLRLYKKNKLASDELYSIYNRLKTAKDVNEELNILNDLIKHQYGVSIKASSREYISNGIKDSNVLSKLLEVLDIIEDDSKSKSIKSAVTDIYKLIK